MHYLLTFTTLTFSTQSIPSRGMFDTMCDHIYDIRIRGLPLIDHICDSRAYRVNYEL